MDIAFLGLVIDGFVLAGLVIAIYFAVSITRSLNAFKNARAEMALQIRELNTTLIDAENAMKALKLDGVNASGTLQDIIFKAKDTASELDILIQSGARLADRLDNGVSNKQNKSFQIRDKDHAPSKNTKPDKEFETRAEQDLYNALQRQKKGRNR